MKKVCLFLCIIITVALACDLSLAVTPSTAIPASATSPVSLPTNSMVPVLDAPTQVPASPTPIPVTSTPPSTATMQQPAPNGAAVFYGPVSLVLPSGVASGVSGAQFSRVEGDSVAPWDVTPGHTEINLEGYLLQGKFHQPQIFVYPVQTYAEMFPAAFESMHRLANIVYGDPGTPIDLEQLPAVPFFNAAQVFASNVQMLSFQNGKGVRFLTEYAQYPAPINNHDLFYQFQGFTDDGNTYVIAIFPITAPVLAETSDGGAILPPGGIPYPDISSSNPDMQGYYTAEAAMLNSTSPEVFAPTIGKLDALVQSIRIAQ